VKISIIGTGYVGLVTGACLAGKGHQIVCVDIDRDKVEKINQGIPPIYEDGLEAMLREQTDAGNLTATTDIRTAVLNTEISLIAVGTPFDGDEIDLRFIRQVSREIGQILKEKSSYHLVVVKSTVVPGTTDHVVRPILEETSGRQAGTHFGVGMNPEFLREGVAVDDCLCPDRIVIGGMDKRSQDLLGRMYEVFPDTPKIRTGNATAEMIKYTSNSLLATLISFSNEIGNLCRAMGNVDVVDVMKGVHLDKRMSPILNNGERVTPALTTYVEAGCGFGGSCFPKDVKAIIAHGAKYGRPMNILEAVMKVNASQPFEILALLQKHFPSLEGIVVAILGLAFKPGTDDMRESPAIPVVKALQESGVIQKAYDPIACREAKKIFGNERITYCEKLEEALEGVDAVVLLTRWTEFSRLPDLLKTVKPQPVMIDGRRMLDKEAFGKYEGIGR
jgi:UDPglucose 6-dehydrogenase